MIFLETIFQVHIKESHLLTDWLKSLGNVEYIVVASSFHTLCIPDVLKAFPNAKVIGKLNNAKNGPLDNTFFNLQVQSVLKKN